MGFLDCWTPNSFAMTNLWYNINIKVMVILRLRLSKGQDHFEVKNIPESNCKCGWLSTECILVDVCTDIYVMMSSDLYGTCRHCLYGTCSIRSSTDVIVTQSVVFGNVATVRSYCNYCSVMQDVALDANGQWIKCVLNMKFIVFHTNFGKYLNLGTLENF